MAKIMPCDGIAVCRDGKVTLKGTTPTVDEFTALRGFLERVTTNQVYAVEALGNVYPAARDFIDRTAGMLVIPLSHAPRDYIVFFRCELSYTRLWAGNPEKTIDHGPNGPRLTPRKSFEAWGETVRGHCTPWTTAERNAADALRVTLLEVVLHLIGTTEKERLAAAQKQELLIAELNHRVRNILGLISGLLTQSRANAGDIETFATVLGDRVHALARAHDQITAENWGPGPLTTLITTEAGAYLGLNAKRIAVTGPAILLQPHAFSAVALVIHELMTNAVKYGALSDEKGHVTIEWRLNVAGDIMLDWKEAGGPSVQTPTRRGFGTTIIERSVPHELGGHTTLDYAASGLNVHIRIPAHYTVFATEMAVLSKSETRTPVTLLPTRLSGPVLLVEDNMIIALDTEDMLISLGATTVAVASNTEEALQHIDLQTPSFALLDVNLGMEMSWPIASRLRQLGVPHIFATGYGMSVDCPSEHCATLFITKPYTFESISRAVTTTLSK